MSTHSADHVEIPITEIEEGKEDTEGSSFSLLNLAGSLMGHHEYQLTDEEKELEKTGITIFAIGKDRILHVLDQEDVKLLKLMKTWMEKHNPTLEELIDKFASHDTADAIAKILFDYPFPDFVLKFKKDEGDDTPTNSQIRRNFERLLLLSGLLVEFEDDTNKEYTFVKIWAPFKRMCEEAEELKLKMPLDNKKFDYLESPPPGWKITEFFRNHFTYKIDINEESATFKLDRLRQYDRAEETQSWSHIVLNFWPGSKRTLLTHHMIINSNQVCLDETAGDTRKKRLRNLAISKLLKDGVYKEFYPLHDGSFKPMEKEKDVNKWNLRAQLYALWFKARGVQPLERIREYFGEKLALYFAWLGFYTAWLLVASVFGIIVVIFGVIDSARTGFSDISLIWDNALSAPFAFIMSIWATCFLETWKRYNAALQFDWDVLEFEKEELPRPEFVGTMVRKSPITFKQEIHFPFGKRLRKLFVSGMIVFVSICIVTVTIGVLLIYPQRLFAYGNAWGSVVVGLINLATVITLNMVYSQSAIWLTDFENHRTATSYEDSLTLKIYLFDFVNFYSALFYIMLFKQKFFNNTTDKDGCQFQSCLTELTIQLAIILIGKQAFGQFQELLLPWIVRKFRKGAILDEVKAFEEKHKRSKRKDSEIPQWTQDDRLVSIHSEVRSEYEEMVVQFGFISLFATAFPLAPLFAFLNNLTEIRSDAYKYLVTNQRAVGHQAQDIGMWENILRVISLLAVLTNAGIIAFHSTYMRKQFDKYIHNDDQLLVARLLFMLIFEHAVFLLKLGFALLIPDVPKAVRVAIERENYMARIALEDEDPAADELEEAEEDDKKIYSLVGSLNLQKLKRVMHHNHVYFHEKSQ